MSTCVVREVPNGLFVRVKLFADDFQERLNEISSRKINFENGIQSYENKAVTSYLNHHLQFQFNGDAQKNLDIKSTLIESKLIVNVEFYLALTQETEVNVLKMRNDIMCEVFDNQRNVVVVNWGENTRKINFTKTKTSESIFWK